MADLEQVQQMIPLITCEIYLCQGCQQVGFLVSMYLIWIFGVQVDSIEQLYQRNSVGPGNMSHCLDFVMRYIILITAFVVPQTTYNKAS